MSRDKIRRQPPGVEHNGAKLLFEAGLYVRGKFRVSLTRKEMAVLTILMRRAGSTVHRETLNRKVFPGNTPLSVDTYVHYLRVKGIDAITTKYGVGYRYCGVCQECRERRH